MFVICIPVAHSEAESFFPLRDVIDQARQQCGMQHKEMWIAQGYREGSQWTRAMQDVPGYAFDLRRMVKLAPRFWVAFIPLFISALTAYWVREFLEDALVLSRARAVLRPGVDRLADLGKPRAARAELVSGNVRDTGTGSPGAG